MTNKLQPLRKPTPKQQHFIKAYVETGNATQAALEAYNTNYSTARSIGYENLTKPHIRQEIEKAMGKVQLTTQDAIRTIKEALEASNNKGPDWTARLKAADMTLRLGDAYPKDRPQEAPQETQQDQNHNLVTRIIETETPEVIRWTIEHRRLPNLKERQKLLGDGKTREDDSAGEVGE